MSLPQRGDLALWRTGLPVCPWAALSPLGQSRREQNPAASGAARGWVLPAVCLSLRGCVCVSVCGSLCPLRSLSLVSLSLSLLCVSVALSSNLRPPVCACLLAHLCPLRRRVVSSTSASLLDSPSSRPCLGRVAGCQSCSLRFQCGFGKAWATWASASVPQGFPSPPHPEQPLCSEQDDHTPGKDKGLPGAPCPPAGGCPQNLKKRVLTSLALCPH